MRLALLRTRLERSPGQQPYIPPAELAAILRANPGVVLPPSVLAYLCDVLDGKIRPPSGRQRDSEQPIRHLQRLFIPIVYGRYLAWLQRREKSVGLAGWRPIRDTAWWQGPPNERAARMTCRFLRLAMDWRRVHNIASAAKRGE
jgi:hypothetical protein